MTKLIISLNYENNMKINQLKKTLYSLGIAIITTPSIANAEVAISTIEAKLFYDRTGTFSMPITPNAPLWNTVIGEGWSKADSNATLIDITLINTSNEFQSNKVAIKVKDLDSKKIILQKTTTVAMPHKTFHLPIMLNNTGCQPLLITANIVGSSQVKKLQIPFQCGE